MTKTPFDHFVITRFNVRQTPNDTTLVTNLDWLNGRMDLFEAYCYPSVCAQTCQNFTWLLFIDSATPVSFVARLTHLKAALPNLEIVGTDVFDKHSVRNAVESRIRPDATHVITTRLDNDDAIFSGFIQGIQDAFTGQAKEAVNWTDGLIVYRGRFYHHQDFSNAFLSLIEEVDGLDTVCARWHTHLHEIALVRQLAGTPAWLQVVHGGNVRNRVRGWRVKPGLAAYGFVLAPGVEVEAIPSASYVLDKLLLDYVRWLREAMIAVLKQVRAVWRSFFG